MDDHAAVQPNDLSCYTANLAAYLSRHRGSGVDEHIAASVRLAVDMQRPDGIVAFSHHDRPLDDLGDGTRLGYWGSDDPEEARQAIAGQLDTHGSAVIVGYSNQLPWGPSTGTSDGGAPHLVLVEDHDGRRWRTVDHFSGVMVTGEQQEPFGGWVSSAELDALMHRAQRMTTTHLLRTAFAFGPEVVVPQDNAAHLLLVRQPADTASRTLGEQWISDTAAALEGLSGWLTDGDGLLHDPGVVDDCWAAAQHHVFRYRYYETRLTDPSLLGAVRTAADKWASVPRTLRFAADSARRGRSRASLICRLLSDVALADTAARRAIAEQIGAGAPAPRDTGSVVGEIAVLVGQQRRGLPPELSSDTTFADDLHMNSAQVVDLLSRLEEHFDCTVQDDDLDTLSRVADLVAIVERRAER